MIFRLLPLLIASLVATSATANPSTGAGASRSTEAGASDKLTREKSLSQDKSTGVKGSTSRSRETSREASRESRQSDSSRQERSRKQDFTVKLNLNPLLISEFIGEFESDPEPHIVSPDVWRRARDFFTGCRPFSNLDSDFPVLKGSLPVSPAASPGNILQLWSAGRPADRVEITTKGRAGGMTMYLNAIKDVNLPPAKENLDSGSIPFYTMCRLAAHYFIADAAALMLEVVAQNGWNLESEQRVRNVVRAAYQHLADPGKEGSGVFWESVIGRAARTWQQARCAPFLGYTSKVGASHNMECGTFRIVGDTVYVRGVPTLSAEVIDGRKFEIALSSGDSDTHAATDESSRGTRASASSRSSTSSETYTDSRRTAGMKASKASETSSSRKAGRDSKAEVTATPGQ